MINLIVATDLNNAIGMQGYTFYYMDGRRVFTYAKDIDQAYKNIGFIPGVDRFIAWCDIGLTNTHWFDKKYKCWNKKQILSIDRITQSKVSSEDICELMAHHSCVRYSLPNEGEVILYELMGQVDRGYIHGWCLTSTEPKAHPDDFGLPNQYWSFADLFNACRAFKLRCIGTNSLNIRSHSVKSLFMPL